jgi:LuxR family maltose regulon positive regulatory protein
MTFARTKIQPPRPRSAFVERAGVQARLAEALRTRRVVLLCAPAGYGKTTLLAQEIARLPGGAPVAWVSADAGDDLQRLLECMLAALEPFDPPWRTAPESLVARVGRSADERRQVAAEIINTLAAVDVPHGVIVFDDVHRVDDPDFFGFLDLLAERMAEGWCIALTSRLEPALSLARLRAADEVAEFRQLDLQFARDEARRLADASGVDRAVADRVFDRTQGWPAGLRIAVGALRGAAAAGGVERALRASERPLFEFLVTEVLEQLPPDLREFLLAVSVLPELDAERCRRVSGRADAAALLDAVERLGLFVDTLDAPVPTLRLHDLFRDALQQRLQQHAPDRLVALRRLAADTEADPLRRIGLLLEAGDADEAARLAFEHLPRVIALAGAASALHVVGRFPAGVRDRAPELAFVRGLAAWAQVWDFTGMQALMEQAARAFAQRGDPAGKARAEAYEAIALIALGRLAEAEALVARLLAQALPPAVEAIVRNAEAWHAIEVCRYRDVAPRMSRLLDLLLVADAVDVWYQTTPTLRMPGLPGMTAVFERHASLLLQVAGEEPTPLRTIAFQTQAWAALWRGRISQARRFLASARDDAHWSGQTRAVKAHWLTFEAVLAVVAGDAAGAMAAVRERLRTFATTNSPWTRYTLLMSGARLAGSAHDVEALRAALAEAAAVCPRDAGDARRRPRELPLLAQQAWLEGRADDAIAAWQQCLAMEESIDVMGLAVEVRVRLAHALALRGGTADAARMLSPLFERARVDGPGGALLAGDALAALAAVEWRASLTAEQQAELRGWAQLVAAERAAPAASAVPVGTDAHGDRAVPAGDGSGLTAREFEVLARIAAGDSNKLIARAFDLSLHTVKRHVANVLAKLDVETRGQAAAWYARHRRTASPS